MYILKGLEPKKVFSYFEDICYIPHPSGHTKALSDYVCYFARAHSLEYHQDALNNVIIIAPATKGYEDAPAVILQGHLDMVAEKDADCPIDMEREGLRLAVDGDRIFAKGTTLGGDDGVAVALMLALLASPEVAHPRLEAVFTVDEEVGMGGAEELDVSPLQGRMLVNLDSEEEGIFTAGCAGSLVLQLDVPLERETCVGTAVKLRISGLTGGHSGMEIDKGRANANKLLGKALELLGKAVSFRLVSLFGGYKLNAIPAASEAVLVPDGSFAETEKTVCEIEKALRSELAAADPGFRLTLEKAGQITECCTREAGRRAISFLTQVPDGVYAMSEELPGLVQTSSNLGILRTDADGLHGFSFARSGLGSQKKEYAAKITACVETLGGTVTASGDGPAWEFRKDSPLRDKMATVFQKVYGYAPKTEITHAGLECGLFNEKLPGLDSVSIGPNMKDIHTPRESLSISSTQRLWSYLVELLKELR